jgi:hypothetical protein
MTPLIYCRITGSALIVLAYFVVIHINVLTGATIHTVGTLMSIPFFITTKSWDVVAMRTFLVFISLSKFFT